MSFKAARRKGEDGVDMGVVGAPRKAESAVLSSSHDVLGAAIGGDSSFCSVLAMADSTGDTVMTRCLQNV